MGRVNGPSRVLGPLGVVLVDEPRDLLLPLGHVADVGAEDGAVGQPHVPAGDLRVALGNGRRCGAWPCFRRCGRPLSGTGRPSSPARRGRGGLPSRNPKAVTAATSLRSFASIFFKNCGMSILSWASSSSNEPPCASTWVPPTK